jgi:hypothetical protein
VLLLVTEVVPLITTPSVSVNCQVSPSPTAPLTTRRRAATSVTVALAPGGTSFSTKPTMLMPGRVIFRTSDVQS